ncbi:MAG: hypothetical protein OHK0056_25120 [Bacteriovoracaceae bacterium]
MKGLAIIILLIALIAKESKADSAWNKTIVSEDSEAFYYVGISEKNTSLKEAMNEAYLEALKEAVRHSFGFRQKYSENSQSSLKDIKIMGQMTLETNEIKFTGITPTKEKIEEVSNGNFIVYRQIKYLKRDRDLEIIRQRNLEESSSKTHTVKGGQGILGKIKISTKPEAALITLTKSEGDFQIQATSNALFEIPIGVYKVNFHKENYLPKTEEVIVAGIPSTYNFDLEVGKGKVDINVTPKDALLYLNNLPLNAKNTELPVGTDYKLRIEHPNYYPEERSFSPWFNEEVKVEVDLRPRPGRITITGNPEGAEVYLGDVYLGTTPILKKEVPATTSRITISKNGFIEYRDTIKVEPNIDNTPVNYVLQKFKKKDLKPEQKLIFSKSESLPSTKRGNATFTYNPVVMEGGNSVFYMIPVGINFFTSDYFSFGFDWRYTYDTEQVDSNEYGYNQKVDYETEYQVISANMRLFLARNDYFSLGIGPEYNHRILRKTPVLESTKNKKMEATDSSFGGNVHLMIPLSQNERNSWGILTDYRMMDFSNSNLNSLSLGVYIEF